MFGMDGKMTGPGITRICTYTFKKVASTQPYLIQ